MPSPERIATPLLSVSAIALIVVLLALGAGGRAADRACGAATDAVQRATVLSVAQRLSDEERAGPSVTRARTTIEADSALAQAVSTGDLATVHKRMVVLLYNHQHIVRIRVLQGGRVVDDIGGRDVIWPTVATLRVGGREVGTAEFSVQDDTGYRLLAERLIGVHTVMRYGGHTVMTNIGVGERPLPASGVVRVGSSDYLVASIVVGRFPVGQLHIYLLFHPLDPAVARGTCEQVRADVLGAINQRVYGEARTGPGLLIARRHVLLSKVLPQALVTGDDRAVRREARALLTDGHIAHLRILAGTRVVADVGSAKPLIEPFTTPIRDRSGVVVGSATLAVQSIHAFVGIAGYLTRTEIVVRRGSNQLGGSIAGPATLPPSGPVSVGAVSYHVASFPGALYPAGRLTISTLAPD